MREKGNGVGGDYLKRSLGTGDICASTEESEGSWWCVGESAFWKTDFFWKGEAVVLKSGELVKVIFIVV